VMATQNPIESEGTYALPEAQVDRFMLKTVIGYPSENEEFVVVERMTAPLAPHAQTVLHIDQVREYQQQADRSYVDPSVITYAVRLATATRKPDSVGLGELARYVSFGASPRAPIAVVQAAKALALLRGRDFVLPSDIGELAPDVMRHRIVLSYEALADGFSADDLIAQVLQRVTAPEPVMRDRA